VCIAAAQPPAPASRTTLYLVLEAGADVSENEILVNLRKGLKASAATTAGDPEIRSVSPLFVSELKSLSQSVTEQPEAVAKGTLGIRRLPSTVETAYELRVGEGQIIKKLRVTYKKGMPKEYTPASSGSAGLVLIVPGRYAFYPDSKEADDSPVSYEGDVSEFGKPDAAVKGEWVRGNKHFVVTMRDFRGNRDELFKAITDPKIVANPFESVTLGDNLEFAFASLRASRVGGEEGTLDPENNITITIPALNKRETARVWVQFPLTSEEMAKSRDELRKLTGPELSAHIRKSEPIRANLKAVVKHGDGSKWYELPAIPTAAGTPTPGFRRKLQLSDLDALAEKYPQAWRLVIWEFDDGKDQEAILLDLKDGRHPLQEQEMPGWKKSLEDALKRKPAAKP